MELKPVSCPALVLQSEPEEEVTPHGCSLHRILLHGKMVWPMKALTQIWPSTLSPGTNSILPCPLGWLWGSCQQHGPKSKTLGLNSGYDGELDLARCLHPVEVYVDCSTF